MNRLIPFYVNEKTAAALLDMKPGEFRSLVRAGHLPPCEEIAPGVERWKADHLRDIHSGRSALPDGGLKL